MGKATFCFVHHGGFLRSNMETSAMVWFFLLESESGFVVLQGLRLDLGTGRTDAFTRFP